MNLTDLNDLRVLFPDSDLLASILDKRILPIDNSTFGNITCPRQFTFSAIAKRVTTGDRSPLVFGQAVHKILERYYSSPNLHKSLYDDTDRIIKEETANFAPQLDALFDPKRNSTSLQTLMYGYFQETKIYGEYLQPITLPNGSLAVETSFSIPLGEITIEGLGSVTVMWEGKIDLIARDTRDGSFCIVDHKTSSMLGDNFAKQFERSTQFSGYLFAARYITKELPALPTLDSVCINAICQKKVNEYKHFRFSRPGWDEQEFREEVLSRLQSYFSLPSPTSLSTGPWQGCRSSCTTKYGSCTFFNLCEFGPAARIPYLMNSGAFVKSNWSPLND